MSPSKPSSTNPTASDAKGIRARARTRFLEIVGVSGDVGRAIREVGVSEKTARRWLDRAGRSELLARRTRLRTNVRPKLDRFFGRKRELDAMDELWKRGHRLVTMVGLGGVGKSRLAWEWSLRRLVSGSFDGGAWFADLSEARSRDDV